MHITLFGSTGRIGGALLDEALDRGHQVTTVVRSGTRAPRSHPRIMVRQGDVLDPASVAAVARGRDVVVSAVGPAAGGGPSVLVDGARSLLDGVRRARAPRLLVIGGASLEVAVGARRPDAAGGSPERWEVAEAHRDAFAIYRSADPEVDWTYVSPATLIEHGERTGRYRVAGDGTLADEHGRSRISIEDFAVAVIDEVETPQHTRQRVRFAY